MHALTSIYDRWRTKLRSVMAEASPRVAASHQHPFPSSSFRTQQDPTGTPDAHLNNLGRVNSATSATSSATVAGSIPKGIPRGIPKGIPGAAALPGLAGNAELADSQMQQATAVEGFLNFVGEDEDELALRKEREEEKQTAEGAQGKL